MELDNPLDCTCEPENSQLMVSHFDIHQSTAPKLPKEVLIDVDPNNNFSRRRGYSKNLENANKPILEVLKIKNKTKIRKKNEQFKYLLEVLQENLRNKMILREVATNPTDPLPKLDLPKIINQNSDSASFDLTKNQQKPKIKLKISQNLTKRTPLKSQENETKRPKTTTLINHSLKFLSDKNNAIIKQRIQEKLRQELNSQILPEIKSNPVKITEIINYKQISGRRDYKIPPNLKSINVYSPPVPDFDETEYLKNQIFKCQIEKMELKILKVKLGQRIGELRQQISNNLKTKIESDLKINGAFFHEMDDPAEILAPLIKAQIEKSETSKKTSKTNLNTLMTKNTLETKMASQVDGFKLKDHLRKFGNVSIANSIRGSHISPNFNKIKH